jgi:hypothetical protein
MQLQIWIFGGAFAVDPAAGRKIGQKQLTRGIFHGCLQIHKLA